MKYDIKYSIIGYVRYKKYTIYNIWYLIDVKLIHLRDIRLYI